MDAQNTEALTVTAQENVNGPMTAEAAAAFLGLSKGYLYKLVSANKIAFYRLGGKILYFARADLENYAFRIRVKSKYELREKADQMLTGGK